MASILTIGGSDSSSGAGIQADIKTAAALGVYATCALTLVTAQNTVSFVGRQAVSPDLIEMQISCILRDMIPDAIKIGALGGRASMEAVARALSAAPRLPIVVDPVMVASTGGDLMDPDAREAFLELVLPLATLITPNIPELARLTGMPIETEAERVRAVDVLRAAGVDAVLLKGGHDMTGSACVDRLYDASDVYEFVSQRLDGEFHGTGCTLATAIACGLATGQSMKAAVSDAHDYLSRALGHTVALGSGSKIIDHLHDIVEREDRE